MKTEIGSSETGQIRGSQLKTGQAGYDGFGDVLIVNDDSEIMVLPKSGGGPFKYEEGSHSLVTLLPPGTKLTITL